MENSVDIAPGPELDPGSVCVFGSALLTLSRISLQSDGPGMSETSVRWWDLRAGEQEKDRLAIGQGLFHCCS